jgi:putative DNA primase/helicase
MTPLAERIAAALDGHRTGEWWRARCPVHGGSSLPLALRDTPRGLAVHCHAGCRREDVLDALQKRGLIGDAAPTCASASEIELWREARARERQHRIDEALYFWKHETRSAVRSLVERYLAARGLWWPLPPTIRMSRSFVRHPEGGSRPCMVASVEHAEFGPVAIHRTFLAVDGSIKASFRQPRMSLGPIGGGAVRLAPADEQLLVSEGIENGMTGMQETAIPAWAALSAGGIESLILPPLPLARRVTILADNDASGRGEEAARNAARRWLAEGREPSIAMPKTVGCDWNDVLRQERG